MGVELVLASSVTAGEGEQDRPAGGGGQLDAPVGEHEVDAQRGADPGQPVGERPGAGVGLGGEGVDVVAVDFVAEQQRPVWRRELLQCVGEGGRFFPLEAELLWAVGLGAVDDAVEVPVLGGGAAGVVGDEVAGGDDGVGLTFVRRSWRRRRR